MRHLWRIELMFFRVYVTSDNCRSLIYLRVIFSFEDGSAEDVDLVDYH